MASQDLMHLGVAFSRDQVPAQPAFAAPTLLARPDPPRPPLCEREWVGDWGRHADCMPTVCRTTDYLLLVGDALVRVHVGILPFYLARSRAPLSMRARARAHNRHPLERARLCARAGTCDAQHGVCRPRRFTCRTRCARQGLKFGKPSRSLLRIFPATFYFLLMPAVCS